MLTFTGVCIMLTSYWTIGFGTSRRCLTCNGVCITGVCIMLTSDWAIGSRLTVTGECIT